MHDNRFTASFVKDATRRKALIHKPYTSGMARCRIFPLLGPTMIPWAGWNSQYRQASLASPGQITSK